MAKNRTRRRKNPIPADQRTTVEVAVHTKRGGKNHAFIATFKDGRRTDDGLVLGNGMRVKV